MMLTWEEAEVAALDRPEWRRSVAQCIHLDAGWIKVKVKDVDLRPGWPAMTDVLLRSARCPWDLNLCRYDITRVKLSGLESSVILFAFDKLSTVGSSLHSCLNTRPAGRDDISTITDDFQRQRLKTWLFRQSYQLISLSDLAYLLTVGLYIIVQPWSSSAT